MSDSMKMALMNGQNSDPWAAAPRTNGMGLMAQGTDTQALPPPVARMQGGFGLSPQMLGLLQQATAPQAAPRPMQQPFNMQSRPVQQARPAYGPGNWSY